MWNSSTRRFCRSLPGTWRSGGACAGAGVWCPTLSLIVQGHDWQFVPTAPGDGENGLVRVFRPGIHIGDTRSEEAIYKLLVSLQRLTAWAEDVFWPVFKADFSVPD
ncbi:unnamed protein product [Clonostachys solani]|uniref:PD-(D/E)XK nuclease-like domain-containing protein n=1 Tax=Clonostachys solani TaxID=160281 RepID=A0A9N9W6J3_9HYPO|nr:unnamed protein product [Clonostachys solani]